MEARGGGRGGGEGGGGVGGGGLEGASIIRLGPSWFTYTLHLITRLLGHPQPQMYPPVALNQYTCTSRVNRTHTNVIYRIVPNRRALREWRPLGARLLISREAFILLCQLR